MGLGQWASDNYVVVAVHEDDAGREKYIGTQLTLIGLLAKIKTGTGTAMM